jgi:hypothetical protein
VENLFIQPEIYIPLDQPSCHGNDVVALVGKRSGIDDLFPQAGDVTPIR